MTASKPEQPKRKPRVPQHFTDDNRQTRRAIIKAIGFRQFKKLYRKAP